MEAAERIIEVPAQMTNAVLPRLPNPEGGRRLIGLMTDALRVHNRRRRHVPHGWLQEHSRPYRYARADSNSERTAWTQSILAEAGRALVRRS
eukprot:7316832-Pyramimonas_sp.AAC.1